MTHFRLTVEDEKAHVVRFQNGDRNAIVPVLKSMSGLIRLKARQLMRGAIGMEDLIAEGELAVITAAGTFDAGRGYAFHSYAIYAAKWRMQDAMLMIALPVSMPHTKECVKGVFYGRGIMHEWQRNGVECTPEKLAEHLDVAYPKRLMSAIGATVPVYAIDGQTNKGGEAEDNGFNPSVESPADIYVAAIDAKAKVKRLMRRLTPKAREVIERRFLGPVDKTQREVADEVGTTQAAVQQLEVRAFREMRRAAGCR